MRRQWSRGFTLIELLVVVVILSILAAVIVPRLTGRTEKARRAKAEADIATLVNLLEQFHLDMSRYPTTREGLAALRHRPEQGGERWQGPYLHKDVANDPWGHPYAYTCPGIQNPDEYDLASYGRDGKEGGEGDDADTVSWR